MDIDTLISYLDNSKNFLNSSETEHLDFDTISFLGKVDETLLKFINETQEMVDQNNKSLYDIHFIKQGDQYIIEYRFFQRINGRYAGTKNIYILLVDRDRLKEYLLKLQNNFTFITGSSY